MHFGGTYRVCPDYTTDTRKLVGEDKFRHGVDSVCNVVTHHNFRLSRLVHDNHHRLVGFFHRGRGKPEAWTVGKRSVAAGANANLHFENCLLRGGRKIRRGGIRNCDFLKIFEILGIRRRKQAKDQYILLVPQCVSANV